MVTEKSSPKPLKNTRILLTCGPTWVALDDIRIISNRSTGELGHVIAGLLNKEGARITLLEGPVSHALQTKPMKVIQFHFFDELKQLLKQELKKDYDIVIHAAAVSDYRPRQIHRAKIRSSRPHITLNLIQTPKLIEMIKTLNPKTFLVGFKLESKISKNNLAAKTNRLFKKAGCDLVIANSMQSNRYQSYILDNKGNILRQAKSKRATAQALVALLKEQR